MNDMTQKNKYQLLVLYGKSGAGKDTILNTTIDANPEIFHRVVSCTTRPPRDGEVDGKDYYFLTTEEMLDEALIPNNLLEISKFNHWYYGITMSSLVKDKINIAVLNPEGIKNLQEKHSDKLDIYLIEVMAADQIRLLRSLEREKPAPNCHEICRRFLADEQMWKDIPLIMDVRIFNYDEDSKNLMERIDTKNLIHRIEEQMKNEDKVD